MDAHGDYVGPANKRLGIKVLQIQSEISNCLRDIEWISWIRQYVYLCRTVVPDPWGVMRPWQGVCKALLKVAWDKINFNYQLIIGAA